MKAFAESGSRADWQNALDQLSTRSYAKDIAAPTFSLPTDRGQVPRADLPYGTPRWMGTSGTRGSRPIDRTTGKPSADYLKIYLPSWVNDLARIHRWSSPAGLIGVVGVGAGPGRAGVAGLPGFSTEAFRSCP